MYGGRNFQAGDDLASFGLDHVGLECCTTATYV